MKAVLFPLTHGSWWAKKGKCPSVPTDTSMLIKTSTIAAGLRTSCSQHYVHNDDFNNVLNREKSQALNISFQLTTPNAVTSRKKDPS